MGRVAGDLGGGGALIQAREGSAFLEEAHFGASSEVHFGTSLGLTHFGAVTEEERGAPQVGILAV